MVKPEKPYKSRGNLIFGMVWIINLEELQRM